jgi:hypothetical protein
MDHVDELLLERVVRPSRVEERGPIPEFLAKKRAEQAGQTPGAYRTALLRFLDYLGKAATVGDVTEAAGFRYLTHLREHRRRVGDILDLARDADAVVERERDRPGD